MVIIYSKLFKSMRTNALSRYIVNVYLKSHRHIITAAIVDYFTRYSAVLATLDTNNGEPVACHAALICCKGK